jgi:predicted AAA+ superfamily ATPase
MKRNIELDFEHWLKEKSPKPVILRGARQVGKSFVVRNIAKIHKMDLTEINFERRPDLSRLFLEKDIDKILRALSLEFDKNFVNGKSLLFLDEIHAVPEAIATLRYFFEEKKGLHVVAAGSLLDIALSEGQFSSPVGRVEYWHMAPMSFKEFLSGIRQKKAVELLEGLALKDIKKEILTENEHEKLKNYYEQYLRVGGMPEVVQAFADGSEDGALDRIKATLLSVYEDDFHKYKKRIPFERLSKVFHAAPRTVGQKFTYAKVDPDEKSQSLGQALTLLCQAKIFYKVYNSSSSGVPLHGQINEKFFKLISLDVGLLQKLLGMNIENLKKEEKNILFEGAIAEQFVGQHLLMKNKVYENPQLHYWARDVGHSKAEVDYVIEHQGKVIPIEVKSGSVKSLKSMQVFLMEKKLNFGIRLDDNLPMFSEFQTALSTENKKIKLLSLPLYFVEEIPRLLLEMNS